MQLDNELKRMIPLTETTFYILISLLEPLHGYGIMQKVETLSNGRVLLGPGTLYGAINNMLSLNLISLYQDDKTHNRKKIYQINDKGKTLINLEMERLKEILKNAEDLLSSGKEKEVDHE